MIDKTSKRVLNYLLNCPDYTFSVCDEFPDFLSKTEFFTCIDYLEQNGYITTKRAPNDALFSATLTHTGLHQKEFNSIALKRYLLDKWIDILACVISVLAFIGAYRSEISAILQILRKALTK